MKVLIMGAGLGGLATALRLSSLGYEVEIVEKHHQAGGRLNQLQKDGFTFDVGPSFFSMSYEFDELFTSCGLRNPLQFNELNPLYAVYFSNRQEPYLIHKDKAKLAKEFEAIEPNFEMKLEKYLKAAREVFHDTEYRVVKRNHTSLVNYARALASVPLRHTPKLLKTMWKELEETFSSEEVKVIFSLVAFFLGATPFDTPAVYTLLNYTELEHDGYWNVQGGMYKITQTIVDLLKQRNVKIHYNVEIASLIEGHKRTGDIQGFVDTKGTIWKADIYVANADAASFRGKVLNRAKYSEYRLDRMDWTFSPFTIYLGVKGKIDNFYHHNYFLGSNFQEYAENIFKASTSPQETYYYVNVLSKHNPESAPENCENLFILCPVPDLRYKSNWDTTEQFADTVIENLGKRIGFDLMRNTVSRTVMNPWDWQKNFNLYKGSGLGLAHGLNQIGGFRPANKDEHFDNLFYVGASTVPGTGLPMVVISSKLAVERIQNQYLVV